MGWQAAKAPPTILILAGFTRQKFESFEVPTGLFWITRFNRGRDNPDAPQSSTLATCDVARRQPPRGAGGPWTIAVRTNRLLPELRGIREEILTLERSAQTLRPPPFPNPLGIGYNELPLSINVLNPPCPFPWVRCPCAPAPPLEFRLSTQAPYDFPTTQPLSRLSRRSRPVYRGLYQAR